MSDSCKSNAKIMDVTLRDGSYAINFQFSDADTRNITRDLSNAGIRYVEIGHGMGLRASSEKNGLSLCSDEEYLEAAQEAAGDAKYGMFCIPGNADVKDLSILKKYGASFVRIGTNVNEVEKSEKYIKYAKDLGLEVFANYMKSYCATPEQFQKDVELSSSYGADCVYIVDSAGSMTIRDIKKYYDAVRNVSDIKIGFHGHNNLGLAVANSLYCYENGFDFVDCSLMGMGRSAGNASTELLVANLIKQDGDKQYDCKSLTEISYQYIRPIFHHTMNALDIYCGIAEFHTSYLKNIHKVASKYNVNPLLLIMKYSEYDKINMDEDKLCEIAANLPKDLDCNMSQYGFNEYYGSEQK